MGVPSWLVVLFAVLLVFIIWQLYVLGLHQSRSLRVLQSLDAELFRLAQEQNPAYGICSSCGRRAIVRYVVPKNGTPPEEEMFYCKPCWWTSSTVTLGDANKHYRDRLTERDRIAASVGPG